MISKIFLSAVAFVLSVPAVAGPLQDQYNAAQAAFDAGRMAEARAGFAALLPSLDANPRSTATAAVVRARLGAAMLAVGDADGALPLLRRAASALPAGGGDWQSATLDIGRASEIGLDYDAAVPAYRAVLAADAQPDGNRLSATVGLVRVLTFSQPAEARVLADAALTLAGTMTTKRVNDSIAELQTLRGRIELNDGKPLEARKWFNKALASAGGIGTRVNIADVRIRGDLALASYQTGDKEAARKYLAYTGAGSLPSQGFEFGADMPLPGCAPTGPLAREDMAIIEFTLEEDGSVNNVTPIYATRRGIEMVFARAVRGWSWRPAAAKALPAFWRHGIRMELRCAVGGPQDHSWGPGSAVQSWLAEHAPEPLPATLRGDAVTLPVLVAELARREAAFGTTSPQTLPVLIAIGSNGSAGSSAVLSAAENGVRVAAANDAPLDLILFFRLRQVVAQGAAAADKSDPHGRRRYDPTPGLEALMASLDTEGRGQTRGAALVAAYVAQQAVYAQRKDKAVAAYRRILAMPTAAMPDGDPLRQVARLQLASFEASASRVDEARSLLAATGLSPDQCAAFPVTPMVEGGGAHSSDFPEEAMQWHFEGNVRVAYDIDAAGRTVGVRTVTAVPPLVFDESTEALARRTRYQPIFRDGAAIGCADMQRRLRYRIAG